MQKGINMQISVSSKAVSVAPGDPKQKDWMFPIVPLKFWPCGNPKNSKRQPWGGPNYVPDPSASQSKQLLSLNLSICGTVDPTVCCRNPTGNKEKKNYIAFLKEH